MTLIFSPKFVELGIRGKGLIKALVIKVKQVRKNCGYFFIIVGGYIMTLYTTY